MSNDYIDVRAAMQSAAKRAAEAERERLLAQAEQERPAPVPDWLILGLAAICIGAAGMVLLLELIGFIQSLL